MNEENGKAKYNVVGTVTIGTDEYRDLISEGIRATQSADEYRSKYWAEQNKSSALAKERDAAVADIKIYKSFLSENDGIYAQFKLWKMGKEE